jgi:hypothetical protein
MSKPLIQQYYNQLDRSFDFSKSKNEETIKISAILSTLHIYTNGDVWLKGSLQPIGIFTLN